MVYCYKKRRVASTPGKLLSYVTDCPFLMVELHKKPLAKFLGLPEELPSSISLEGDAQLVLSTKRDCYYMTTPKGSSCKAGTYGRMCKHRKALESERQ